MRVSPYCEVFRGFMRPWSILAPRSPSLAKQRICMGHTNPFVSLTSWFYNRIFLGNAAMLLKIVDRLAAFRKRTRLEQKREDLTCPEGLPECGCSSIAPSDG